MRSVFAKYEQDAYPYRWAAQILVSHMAGGVPNKPEAIRHWIETNVQGPDAALRGLIAETMVERGVELNDAIDVIAGEMSVNGFKRNGSGLYAEGRQVKACIKEAASIAVEAGKIPQRGYGKASQAGKGLRSFLPEHVFVVEDQIPLGVNEPSGRIERPIHVMGPRGPRDAMKAVDYVDEVKLDFTVISDWDFSEEWWAAVWLVAEQNGIGGDRSQGFGRFVVTRWEKLS